MCCCRKTDKSKGCQKPENLKTRPEKCSAEQVRECHGDAEGHPCTRASESGSE